MNKLFSIMLVIFFTGFPLGAISNDYYDAGYRDGQNQGYNDGHDDGLDEAKRRINNDQYRRSPNQYDKALRILRFLDKKDKKDKKDDKEVEKQKDREKM